MSAVLVAIEIPILDKFQMPVFGTTINIGLILAPSLAISDFLLKMERQADQGFVQSTFETCSDAELSLHRSLSDDRWCCECQAARVC